MGLVYQVRFGSSREGSAMWPEGRHRLVLAGLLVLAAACDGTQRSYDTTVRVAIRPTFLTGFYPTPPYGQRGLHGLGSVPDL